MSASITLRYYQKEAYEAYDKYLKENKKGNGVIDLPTAAGKGYLLAYQIKQYTGKLNARVMVVTHSQKLVKQNYDKSIILWPEGKKLFGINSEGLGRRETDKQVLFCGIQSVYKLAKKIGKVNFLIIDEAQRVNLETSVQYKRFIKDMLEVNPDMRVCGLSATPWRMGSGLIYGPSSDLLFDDLVYKANTKELIAQGYLAKPITPSILEENRVDTTGVRIQNSDYVDADLEKRVNVHPLIKSQMDEVLKNTPGLKSIAVFAVSINHAENIAKELRRRGESVAVIHSKSEEDDDKLITAFERQEIRFLISVNMFVEGFDCPNIQAIVDIKPTRSVGRYVQMYGRGFRLCPAIGKKSFFVFDFAGNVAEHGPVDQVLPPAGKGEKQPSTRKNKQCERCGMPSKPTAKVCSYCGWPFPKYVSQAEENTSAHFGRYSIISEPYWINVDNLRCFPHKKKQVITAHYYCDNQKKFTKEIQFDEEGMKWLRLHLDGQLPFDVSNFFKGGYRSIMKTPTQIFVDEAGEFSKILDYKF